jgi:hypothetical protein
MEFKNGNMYETSRKSSASIVLYVAAIVVALIGIALLVNNVLLFRNTVSQYVAQGYPAAEVNKQLVPTQLIPGIFEPIAVYGGIAFALFGIGIINKKVSNYIIPLNKVEACNASIDENDLGQNVVVENTETSIQTETAEETKND